MPDTLEIAKADQIAKKLFDEMLKKIEENGGAMVERDRANSELINLKEKSIGLADRIEKLDEDIKSARNKLGDEVVAGMDITKKTSNILAKEAELDLLRSTLRRIDGELIPQKKEEIKNLQNLDSEALYRLICSTSGIFNDVQEALNNAVLEAENILYAWLSAGRMLKSRFGNTRHMSQLRIKSRVIWNDYNLAPLVRQLNKAKG